MAFDVIWKPSAKSDLASIWLSAKDRGAVTAAADTLDRLLKANPYNCGESRRGNLRIAFVLPLGIDFELIPDDQLVHVLAVWTVPQRPR